MTRFNHIRQHTSSILDSTTWSVSEPDRYGRIKLQCTCQNVSLESEWISIEDAKQAKQGMERMVKEIIFAEQSKHILIRRKGA
jgi:hypothetical protein